MKTESNLKNESAFNLKLDSLDLTMIKQKMIYSKKYDADLVNEIEYWYKRFLFLNYKYDSLKIVPNELIDEFWHQHILDTRKYATDCESLFGEMLHHFPYFGMRGEEDRIALNKAYEETKMLYVKEYGEVPFMDDNIRSILNSYTTDNSTLVKAASCSDCSGQTGTGTE